MLEQIARHGSFDLTVEAEGDVEIDGHHTTEDVGIVLGSAVLRRSAIAAASAAMARPRSPMDEALVTAALDLSGRPYFVWRVPLPKAKLGNWDVELAEVFFEAFARTAQANLHLVAARGAEPAPHHRDQLQGLLPCAPHGHRAGSALAGGALDEGMLSLSFFFAPDRGGNFPDRPMEIIPAIDLLDGKRCVCAKGATKKVTVYSDNPPVLAAGWSGRVKRGARRRSGRSSRGQAGQRRAGAADRRRLRLRSSGGRRRTLDGGRRRLLRALGVDRVVLGTRAPRSRARAHRRRKPTRCA